MQESFENLKSTMIADGCVFVRNFFSASEIAEIRKEIEVWEKKDLEERQQAKLEYGRFEGSAGITFNNTGRHIMTDIFGLSPKLDHAFGRFFDNPEIAKFLQFLGGKNLKLRGYNTRHLNGYKEYSAMEWHRDNIGEITIGLVLDDTSHSSDGATCYIPGSHHYPYCPFKEAQFTMPYPIPPTPKWKRYFSDLLEKKTTTQTKDANGKPGDVYIFIADLWHGRRPNLGGSKGMVFFIGLFPTEIPFPSHSKVVIPPAEILNKLPPSLRKLVDFTNTSLNTEKSSYFYQKESQKLKTHFFSLWNLAKIEKSILGHFNFSLSTSIFLAKQKLSSIKKFLS